jgi:ankyrin repeat protein
MDACRDGNLEIVEELCSRGAHLDATNLFGETALMLACREPHLEIVKALCVRGASIYMKSTSGETAITMAPQAYYWDLKDIFKECKKKKSPKRRSLSRTRKNRSTRRARSLSR